jgi:hypothetical protein
VGLHRLRGFLGIIAALAITAGALIAALAPDGRGPDAGIDQGF